MRDVRQGVAAQVPDAAVARLLVEPMGAAVPGVVGEPGHAAMREPFLYASVAAGRVAGVQTEGIVLSARQSGRALVSHVLRWQNRSHSARKRPLRSVSPTPAHPAVPTAHVPHCPIPRFPNTSRMLTPPPPHCSQSSSHAQHIREGNAPAVA